MISGTPASNAQLGAILLAAGSSSRLGRPKQLIEIDGEPLVVSQAKALLSLQPACVLVVCGAGEAQVSEALADLPVRLVRNPGWAQGMGSSLACGIRAMPERVRAALVLLCDQWNVSAPDLQRLVEAWGENPRAAILSASEEASGPPAILPREMFERLSRLEGDVGARKILKRWHGTVHTVPIPGASADIDTAEDIPNR